MRQGDASGLVAGYGADPAIPDEMVDRDGRLRPLWNSLVRYLGELGPGEIAARFSRGDQYLRDAGVYYRHYGKGEVALRDWPLSHIPVLIAESEWQSLASGLVQRADLLETVVADLYGANRLVAEGDLPGRLVGLNPHWLRPLVGVLPASGHFLHFIAMELGRGPDGRWWVLGDRTEAPSGAGFALENRVATARVFSDIYRGANVLRLAGFFRAFKRTLEELQQPGSNRPGVLSPGPYNESYYEQAYIARYLGLALLEGEDLVVENDQLMVRTIGGPRPISVLWRRLEAAWCDPLELDERSRLGAPGMLAAVRAGSVSLINALGAGVLETQALLAFLPALCEKIRGEPLAIPNIATWWCGQEAEYRHVRENAARMMIGPALSNRLPFERDRGETDVTGWIDQNRHDLIGQELATLSTTPTWIDGRLEPRPVSIRVFLARTREGWQVMPGGFARVSAGKDPSAIMTGRGGSVADVWIVSPAPVPEITLLSGPAEAVRRVSQTVLPSRAADNLYWLGRYVERAEGLLRLLRADHARRAEMGDADAPILKAVHGILETYGVDGGAPLPESLLQTLDSAVHSASHVRDRFSMDGWAALADLSASARQLAASVAPGDDAARAIGVLIRKLSGFSGLVHENMYRHSGWRFLSIGRALERAIGMCGLLAALIGEDAPDGALDLAIEAGDSVMSHRRQYTVATRRETVVDLLVLDALNPRAVLYEIERLHEHASVLPRYAESGQLSELARSVLRLKTLLATTLPGEVDPEWLEARRGEAAAISDLLTADYLA